MAERDLPKKPPSEDPSDLGAITQWGFGKDNLWYREATSGAGMASLAVTTRTVNAAYNLSASIFVKKFLALHDRERTPPFPHQHGL